MIKRLLELKVEVDIGLNVDINSLIKNKVPKK